MDKLAFCHYPAAPPPKPVQLTQVPSRPCPYLANREETIRAFFAKAMDPLDYHAFMDAGFRRSGNLLYQHVCVGCRECVPLRVLVKSFEASKSQRRCRRRNADLAVAVGPPGASREKFELYARYQAERHDGAEPEDPIGFLNFLYRSPVNTVEFTYRDQGGRLLAVGICDVCAMSISSVYFYFDPSESRRGLGTFGALCEIDYAVRQNIDYFYLGFWVKESAKMAYKADFRPYELLQPDGTWI
jgi:arginyl-tRNA--protein-N-Asp/Glu arginylyltransferase